MNPTTRTTVTRIATTTTDTVLGMVNGLGGRFAGVGFAAPAAILPSGATPSRGYAGADPADHRPERDCQSPGDERRGLSRVAMWQPKQAAKRANPN